MNYILSVIVLGSFRIETVSSYISSSPKSGGFAPWKHNSENSLSKPPSNIDLDDIFREEYHAWAKKYDKSTSDETRYENFKLNFMLQMQHNKKTGKFNLLNEFGDMTEKEFESEKNNEINRNNVTNTSNNETKAATVSSKHSSDNVVEIEVIVGKEPIPRVRMLGSETISRVAPFDSPTRPDYATQRNLQQRQQPNSRTQKVSLDPSPVLPNYYGRRMAYTSTSRRPTSGSPNQQRDPSQPRVYPQSQTIDQATRPRRKRRLVRVGPDKIL
mmetsp:Transcript_16293/g.37704  ORF Transcript_16293/g.37704 Transcript_16293/m.37704 type:complete len:271 (-) Transcript_16293:101-913(-)